MKIIGISLNGDKNIVSVQLSNKRDVLNFARKLEAYQVLDEIGIGIRVSDTGYPYFNTTPTEGKIMTKDDADRYRKYFNVFVGGSEE